MSCFDANTDKDYAELHNKLTKENVRISEIKPSNLWVNVMLNSFSATQKAKTISKHFFIIYLNTAPPDIIETFYYFITASNFALG